MSKQNKKWFWLSILILFITFMLWYIGTTGKKAGASFTLPICNADHKYDCVTPTPTQNPCKEWKYEEDCITPTPKPTVTPTASQSATPTPTSTQNGGSGGASGNDGANQPPPVAQCGTPFDVPTIVSFTDKGNGTVNFAWTEGQTVDKYSITYGYSPDNLNMGEVNIPGNVTNWDIHQLNIGSHVWAQIQAWFHGCEESSNVFDPLVK